MTTRKKTEPEPEEVAPQTTPQPAVPQGGELAEYEVDGPDGSTLTVLLTEADAKASGAKSATAANKAKQPSNK